MKTQKIIDKMTKKVKFYDNMCRLARALKIKKAYNHFNKKADNKLNDLLNFVSKDIEEKRKAANGMLIRREYTNEELQFVYDF